MKVKLLDERAKVPTVEYPGSDLGYDLYALEDVSLPLGIVVKVRTGIAVEFDKNWGAIIKDRSSMASKSVTVSAGVVDSGYRGEILVLLTLNGESYGNQFRHYDIKAGDKIAQLVLTPSHTWRHIQVVKELGISERGIKGFGSSGR